METEIGFSCLFPGINKKLLAPINIDKKCKNLPRYVVL